MTREINDEIFSHYNKRRKKYGKNFTISHFCCFDLNKFTMLNSLECCVGSFSGWKRRWKFKRRKFSRDTILNFINSLKLFKIYWRNQVCNLTLWTSNLNLNLTNRISSGNATTKTIFLRIIWFANYFRRYKNESIQWIQCLYVLKRVWCFCRKIIEYLWISIIILIDLFFNLIHMSFLTYPLIILYIWVKWSTCEVVMSVDNRQTPFNSTSPQKVLFWYTLSEVGDNQT